MKLRATLAATALAALGAVGAVATASPASAAPDTACQKAGLKTLIGARLIDDVAKGGLPIATAVSTRASTWSAFRR